MFNFFKRRKPKITIPSDEWFKEVSDKSAFTPDVANLMRSEFQKLFVVDEYMKPHWKHDYLQGVTKKFVAFTQDSFSAWRSVEGHHSEVIPLTKKFYKINYATIRGELYGVPSKLLMELDKDKENGVKFNRVRVKLVIPYTVSSVLVPGEVKTSISGRIYQEAPYFKEAVIQDADWTQSAWMYIGHPEYWDQKFNSKSVTVFHQRLDGERQVAHLIDSSYYTPLRLFTPRNPNLEPYYYHSPHECNND